MESAQKQRPRFSVAALWGVLGFTLLLVQAIYRLSARAVEPIAGGHMHAGHWVLYGLSVAGLGYAEGYRAFQLRASPRIVARAMYLASHPRPLHVALAPFFCTGLFHATRRRMIASWLLYAGIIALILAVRALDQPWRGMVDAGVVVGLSWGAVSILIYYVRALAGHPPAVSPELPDPDPAGA